MLLFSILAREYKAMPECECFTLTRKTGSSIMVSIQASIQFGTI